MKAHDLKSGTRTPALTILGRISLAAAVIGALAGCVTTQDGKKKFAPIEAAQHLDQNVGTAEDQYLQ